MKHYRIKYKTKDIENVCSLYAKSEDNAKERFESLFSISKKQIMEVYELEKKNTKSNENK